MPLLAQLIRGQRLLEKSCKSGATEQNYFYSKRESVQAADPAKYLQVGAGRALEAADPQKWPKVGGDKHPAHGAKPGCPENPVA